MPDWPEVYPELEKEGVTVIRDVPPAPVSGGDISAAWRVRTTAGDLFLKTGPTSSVSMFSAEAEALREIASAGAVRVPHVVAFGEAGLSAYLAMEWLDLESVDETIQREFGEQLAALHQTTSRGYGWHRDNSIGLTAQLNSQCDDWIDFFRERRLRYQLRLAVENGFGDALQSDGARLLARLPVYFNDEPPVASLLHGDLWGGNWGCCNGEAVVFDPAVYYGDRETDLAMARLFGGFSEAFFSAYEFAWPLADGHRERRHLYQLYHVLNHLNLFGSAYLGQAQRLIRTLL